MCKKKVKRTAKNKKKLILIILKVLLFWRKIVLHVQCGGGTTAKTLDNLANTANIHIFAIQVTHHFIAHMAFFL